MLEVKFNKPQNVRLGDCIFLYRHGNFRPWTVESYNAKKTSLVLSSTFGE